MEKFIQKGHTDLRIRNFFLFSWTHLQAVVSYRAGNFRTDQHIGFKMQQIMKHIVAVLQLVEQFFSRTSHATLNNDCV